MRATWAVVTAGVAGVLVYLSPYFVLGQDAHVLVHDHLDVGPDHNWRYLHSENPFWRSGRPDESFMAGSHQAPVGPDPRGDNWAYYFLPPFAAFVLMQVVSRLIAFGGMYCLVRELWPARAYVGWVATATGLLFAIVPHQPCLPCTVPVLPWVCYALLRVHRGTDRWWHWLALCLAPLLSFFIVAPLFLLIVLGLSWFVAGLRERRWRPRTAAALALTGALYALSSYELALHALGRDYVSHRSVRQALDESTRLSFRAAWEAARSNFLRGHYHAPSHHGLILGLAVGTLAVGLVRGAGARFRAGGEPAAGGDGPPGPSPVKTVLLLLALAAAFSLVLGLWHWQPVARARQSLPVVRLLNLSRFYWLAPLGWYAGLAAVLCYWTGRPWLRARRLAAAAVVGLVFAAQSFVLVSESDWTAERRAGRPTYRQFFAAGQFGRIAEFIGQPQAAYRVASLGMHPAIAHYNGFHCLDGYSPDYSLGYHRAFRRAIAPELDRSERRCAEFDPRRPDPPPFDCKTYFDTWGNRCYLPSAELPAADRYFWTRDKEGGIERLELDRAAFREMGGRYILSAVAIRQADDCGLRLLAVFDGDGRETVWQVRLYEVLP